jgi:hypothetical protein
MSAHILLVAFAMGGTTLRPGDTLTDAADAPTIAAVNAFFGNGVALWPATDTIVAGAAAAVAKLRKNHSDAELSAALLAAVGYSVATSGSSSAAAAAASAAAAATSATTATTQATNAATSATAAAASAALAAAQELVPSATVITADPAPAVVGTFYDCDPSGGAFNITLPAIGSGNHGKRIGINVVTTSANAVTPVPNGTDTLPANLTSVPGAYGRRILMADNNASPKTWRLYGT